MIPIAATEMPPAIVVPAAPPSVKGPRATVRTVAAVPLRTVWSAFVPISLCEVFPKSKGPIPAVQRTSGQDGRWDVVGRSRSVHMRGGSTVREEVTFSDPTDGRMPTSGNATFSYRISGFSGAIGGLAREAHGTWRFEELGPDRTSITWTYTFVPKGGLASVPLGFVVSTFWRSYMRDGIKNVKLIAEREQSAPGVSAGCADTLK